MMVLWRAVRNTTQRIVFILPIFDTAVNELLGIIPVFGQIEMNTFQ